MNFWYWWIAAAVLLVIEMLVPATYFLCMSIAAVVVGGVAWVAPATWEYQVFSFALLTGVTTIVFKRYFGRHKIATDQPQLNRRGEQYVGRTFTLDMPIVNGVGKVRVDDSTWKIEGDDMPAGTLVQVVGVDGTVFRVAKHS